MLHTLSLQTFENGQVKFTNSWFFLSYHNVIIINQLLNCLINNELNAGMNVVYTFTS
ncbi:hypothetical protein VAE122_2960613 [Vibrio aestuarianus]|nr:hypothetical protein VAE122_2960613 [Vibrio aestuarianus]